jgi:diguanylate cyclase (GGDEF)-like protein
MTLLIVSKVESDGNILRYGLQDALGKHLILADVCRDLPSGADAFKKGHHDLIIVHGWKSPESEAFVLKIRRTDSNRHTGIIILAETSEGFDRLVVDNYNAGADEVAPSNLSIAILRSKIIMLFNYKITTDLLRSVNHKLQTMTVTDELTGCANMRGFTKKFAKIMEDCKSEKIGVAVLMIDLDHFKKVNDTHNHLVGSHVIRSMGQLLLNGNVLGGEDVPARYGGDEFVVLLRGDSMENQLKKAQKICSEVSKKVFVYESIEIKITASIGFAWASPGFSGPPSDLVKAADAMLYKSKDSGRNQVSAMKLTYPIDFSNISTQHMIEQPNVVSDLKKASSK